MISLSWDRFFVLEYGLRSNPHSVDVQQLSRIDDKLAEGALDGELLESMAQLLAVMKQDPIELRHLLGRRHTRCGRVLQMVGHFQQVFFTVNQVVRPSHVHELMIEQHLHVAQRFFHLKVQRIMTKMTLLPRMSSP